MCPRVAYKCLHNMASGYLSTLCQPVSCVPGRRHLRSARRGELDFPRVNLAVCLENNLLVSSRQPCGWLSTRFRLSVCLCVCV